MTRAGEPLMQIIPRESQPEGFPGSLTRNADLEADRWHFDTRRAAQFRETTRGQIEAAIERLIEFLDQIDGDAEAEPIDEREPDHEGEVSAQPAHF